MDFFTRYFDTFFPVRVESIANVWAQRVDRAIYFCVLLTALMLPVSIAATNIAWASGLLFWVIRAFVKPRLRWFRTPLDYPILAFYVWGFVTCVFSYAPDLSFDRTRVMALFPIFYLVAQNIRSSKSVKLIIGALIFSSFISVVWSYGERINGRGVQVFELQANSPLISARLNNLDDPFRVKDGDTLVKINGKKFHNPDDLIKAFDANGSADSIKLNVYRPDYYVDVNLLRADLLAGETSTQKLGFNRWGHSRNWRSAGFYDHYVTYAETLQLLLSLLFGVFIVLQRKNSRFGYLLIFVMFAMGGVLLLTATRSSQIGLILSALAIVAFGANRKMLFVITALLLPLAIVAAIYVQQTRNTGFADSSDDSTKWRLTVWREGVNLSTESPRHLIFGVGVDSIKRFKCDWGLFANCTLQAGHFHSNMLQIAVETGLPALGLWLWLMFAYARMLFVNIWKREFDFHEKGILLGAFGGFIGFLTSGLVQNNFGTSIILMMIYLIMGLSFTVINCRSTVVGEHKTDS
ncbi:MAG: O-antigen ligase family protein [Pyrinomonadaceae bacterium]|nr:O-antigen ligase family protein [Pyrinomonadaceae bacterium]